MTREKPFRQRFTDAVWSENALKPAERLVALAYVKYAGAKDRQTGERAADDVSYVDWRTLATITGIRSRDTLSRTTRALIEAGWLTQIEPPRQHRAPRYQLAIPTDPRTRFTLVVNGQEAHVR